MISIIDSVTSVALAAETFNTSVASITTLLPASNSSEDPAGIGALVISSTSWLASLLLPARFAVSDDSVTVANGESRIIHCDGAGSGAAVTDFTSTMVASTTFINNTASGDATALAIALG